MPGSRPGHDPKCTVTSSSLNAFLANGYCVRACVCAVSCLVLSLVFLIAKLLS
jgi:hypothetical protein